MERFLESARSVGARSDREVIATFEHHLASVKCELFEAARRLWSLDDSLSLDALNPPALIDWLKSCFHSVDELHLHLSYLHGPWTAPETTVFVRALFERFARTQALKSTKLSIIPSDVLMFEEVNLTTYLAARLEVPSENLPANHTLFLPKIEINNPLQWAPLVHEMGHAIASAMPPMFSETEVKTITGDIGGAKQVLHDWSEEIFCDFLSLQLLGPAYLASFIDFVTLFGTHDFVERGSDTHPPPRLRICTMLSHLERNGIECKFTKPVFGEMDLATLFYRIFETHARLGRRHGPTHIQERAQVPIDLHEFTNVIESKVLGQIENNETLKSFDARKFKHLKDRLDNNIPIGAYSPVKIDTEANGVAEHSLDEISNKLEEQVPDISAIEAALAVSWARVRETPCTVAEIVNAGWLFKCERIYSEVVLSARGIDDASEEGLKNRLFCLDDLLKNSIETAYLQTFFESDMKPS